jgi:hypothetical protein
VENKNHPENIAHVRAVQREHENLEEKLNTKKCSGRQTHIPLKFEETLVNLAPWVE